MGWGCQITSVHVCMRVRLDFDAEKQTFCAHLKCWESQPEPYLHFKARIKWRALPHPPTHKTNFDGCFFATAPLMGSEAVQGAAEALTGLGWPSEL